MAEVNVTLFVRKRWWFHIAYGVGLVAYALRLLNGERADRYIEWIVGRGVDVGVR